MLGGNVLNEASTVAQSTTMQPGRAMRWNLAFHSKDACTEIQRDGAVCDMVPVIGKQFDPNGFAAVSSRKIGRTRNPKPSFRPRT